MEVAGAVGRPPVKGILEMHISEKAFPWFSGAPDSPNYTITSWGLTIPTSVEADERVPSPLRIEGRGGVTRDGVEFDVKRRRMCLEAKAQ